MLALVVVKVHDDLDLSKCKANVEIIGDGKCIHRSRRKIRRMPEKREVTVSREEIGDNVSAELLKKICQVGYNACVGEIKGEYDDDKQTAEEN